MSRAPKSASALERPFVTLKAAVTLDGRIASQSGESKWISSKASRRCAHRMRAQSDAVLVGISTVLADDPLLDVRLVRGKNPLRVVLDSRLRTPLGSKVARVTKELRTLIFCGPRASVRKRAEFVRRGVALAQVPLDTRGRLRLPNVLRELARRDVKRLLVEGGSRVHGAFLDQGLADRVALFIAPRILGDAAALPFATRQGPLRLGAALALEGIRVRRLGGDLLVEGGLPHNVYTKRSRTTR